MASQFVKEQEVEVRSKDEGFEGSWFKATILRKLRNKQNRFLIRYDNLLDETGKKQLTENVDSRYLRPLPPTGSPRMFKPEEQVEAFDNDGWWEGVISEVLEDSNYRVYFKSSKESKVYKQSDLRLHLKWIDGRWVSTSHDQGTSDTAQNERTLPSPNPTDYIAERTDVAIQHISSAARNMICEDFLSVARNTSVRRDNEPIANTIDLPSGPVVLSHKKMNLSTPEGDNEPSAARNMICEDFLSVARNTSVRRDNEPIANTIDLPSGPVVLSHKKMNLSTPEGDNAILKSSKKVRKVEATKASMSIKACDARGMLLKSPPDVEARSALTFQTWNTKCKRSKLHSRKDGSPVPPEQILGFSLERSAEDNCAPFYLCERNGNDEWNSSEGNLLMESSSQLHLDVAKGIESGVVALPTSTEKCIKEQHVSIEGVACFSDNDDLAKTDLTAIQENGSQLLGRAVDDRQSLSLCFGYKKGNLTMEDKGDNQLVSNEAVTPRDALTTSLNCPQFSDEVQSPLSSEAREGETVVQSVEYVRTDMCSSPTQQNEDPLPPEKEGYPFIKNSPMWRDFESLEIFQLMPQYPHFRPLEKENEELREGMALGYMLSFSNFIEITRKTRIDDPRSKFESRLMTLSRFEELGFDVQPIRFQLEELLKIKDSYNQLDDRSKIAEVELTDGKRKLEGLQESIVKLKSQLQALLTEKGMEDLKVAEQQRMVDEIKESILGFRLDFDSMVAGLWK